MNTELRPIAVEAAMAVADRGRWIRGRGLTHRGKFGERLERMMYAQAGDKLRFMPCHVCTALNHA